MRGCRARCSEAAQPFEGRGAGVARRATVRRPAGARGSPPAGRRPPAAPPAARSGAAAARRARPVGRSDRSCSGADLAASARRKGPCQASSSSAVRSPAGVRSRVGLRPSGPFRLRLTSPFRTSAEAASDTVGWVRSSRVARMSTRRCRGGSVRRRESSWAWVGVRPWRLVSRRRLTRAAWPTRSRAATRRASSSGRAPSGGWPLTTAPPRRAGTKDRRAAPRP